jgi:hypothetical protein
MITYTTKKLYKGYVSIRSYIVEKAIRMNQPILIQYANKKNMLLTPKDLKEKGTYTAGPFKSKYGNLEYFLVDYLWRPRKDFTMELFN